MIEQTQIAPAPYVTIPAAAVATGYTVKAIRRKIEDGIWVEGREYIKAPDGHVLISMKGYTQWAEQGSASKSASGRSASASRSKASQSAAPSP